MDDFIEIRTKNKNVNGIYKLKIDMISLLILPPQDQVVIHSCNIHILLKHMINASYDSINHYNIVHHSLIFRQTDPFRRENGAHWCVVKFKL